MARLSQTYLLVTDIEESIRFYESIFGLTIEERSDDKAVFDTGPGELVLEADFTEETLQAFGLTPPGPDRGNGVIIVLEVDDVDRIAERAGSDGVDVLFGPEAVDWGRRICLLEDPDGYVIEAYRPL